MLDFIVIQMSKVNREESYPILHVTYKLMPFPKGSYCVPVARVSQFEKIVLCLVYRLSVILLKLTEHYFKYYK